MPSAIPRLRAALGLRDDSLSESDRVERGIVLMFAVLRIGVALQMFTVFWFIVAEQSISRVMLPLTVAMVGFDLVCVVAALRRGSLGSTAWGIADLATGAAALVASSLLIPPAYHVGSWLNWAPGYLNQVAAFISGWLRSIRGTFAVGASLGILYVGVILHGNEAKTLAVVLNGSSYALFALAAAVFAKHARRLAAASDENRHLAIATAEALAKARYSFHVHNATGLLEALSNPSLDPAIVPSLKRQAGQEANRLRYEVLRGHEGAPTDTGPTRLASVVWDATETFGHLPLELALELGGGALLTRAHALAVKAALVALLYNVQLHAHASTVTIHADQDATHWELTVADDGIGFDPDPSRFGFGLRKQVAESLAAHDLGLHINSHPGEGTCTTITGPITRR